MAWAHKFNLPITAWENSGAGFTSRTVNAGAAVAVDDVISVWVPYRVNGDTSVTVTDDLGNTYTEDTNTHYYAGATWSHIAVRYFVCRVTNAGTPTLTASFGATVTFPGIFATVRTGLSATPFQVSATPLRTSSVAGATDALVTNAANVATPPVCIDSFAYAMTASSGYTLTAGTGYTSRLTGQNSTNNRDLIRTEDKRVTASGNNVATWTPNFAGVDCVALQVALSEAITVPTIQSATASPADGSTGNTVGGVVFGSNTGLAGLTIGGQAQTITAWTTTLATYTAVRGINLNGVPVNAVLTDSAGVSSDPYAIAGFQPPAGWNYVTLTSVWPVAAERIQSVLDPAIGNQIEWNDLTISIDASGVILWPPGTPDGYTFLARIGVAGEGWGAPEVQTYNPITAGGSGSRRTSLAIGLGL